MATGYTKEELTTIEEMAKTASKSAATGGDDGAFAKYGALWAKTSGLIASADAPKQTRTRKAKPDAGAHGGTANITEAPASATDAAGAADSSSADASETRTGGRKR